MRSTQGLSNSLVALAEQMRPGERDALAPEGPAARTCVLIAAATRFASASPSSTSVAGIEAAMYRHPDTEAIARSAAIAMALRGAPSGRRRTAPQARHDRGETASTSAAAVRTWSL